MKKQILIVQGGGHPKGNTARLVSALAQGAESALKNEVKGCPAHDGGGHGSLAVLTQGW